MSEPPAGAGDDLDDAVAGALAPHHHPACFGCGPENALGLHLPWSGVEPGDPPERYRAVLHFAEHHRGAPGITHGGVVSAALDEAMGILAGQIAFPAVTARMEVRYRAPAPTLVALELRARLRRRAGRQLHLEATLRDGETPLADADGVFVQVPLRHFLRTQEGRAVRDTLRDELSSARRGRAGTADEG